MAALRFFTAMVMRPTQRAPVRAVARATARGADRRTPIIATTTMRAALGTQGNEASERSTLTVTEIDSECGTLRHRRARDALCNIQRRIMVSGVMRSD